MLSKEVINAYFLFILSFYQYKSDDYLREGLISEIKIMQKLKSPNIV